MKKSMVSGKIMIIAAVASLCILGCGGKEADSSAAGKTTEEISKPDTSGIPAAPSDTAALKIAAKMMEQGMKAGGQDVDVKVNNDDKSFSMTVTDENNKQSTMTMSTTNDASQMNITGPDGAMTMQSGAGTKIPENFPEDIPLYPGIKIQMVMENAGPAYSIVGTTSDSVDDVSAFYKKNCVEKGWKQLMDMTHAEGTSMLHYEKDERVLMVLISVEDGEVNININTGTN